MSPNFVEVGGVHIKTTVSAEDRDIDRLVKDFMCNHDNKLNVIGLDAEQSRVDGRGRSPPTSVTALLQLCDGDQCLVVPCPSEDLLPLSLFNFLNLPHFTFVGVGIGKNLAKLQSECGLSCKNAVEVGPSSWELGKMTGERCRAVVSEFVSIDMPSSVVFEDWGKDVLNKRQIKLAVSNAYSAFRIGNLLLGGSND